ncbi:hypothetical protein B0H34DRAFT_720322, partial [Crassisporium funariophilum]
MVMGDGGFRFGGGMRVTTDAEAEADGGLGLGFDFAFRLPLLVLVFNFGTACFASGPLLKGNDVLLGTGLLSTGTPAENTPGSPPSANATAAFGVLGLSVYKYLRSGGDREPAARRAWMSAISSCVKPASAREVLHDGGRPTYPSSTWMLCWKFHGWEICSSSCGGGGSGSAMAAGMEEVVGGMPALVRGGGERGLRFENLRNASALFLLLLLDDAAAAGTGGGVGVGDGDELEVFIGDGEFVRLI